MPPHLRNQNRSTDETSTNAVRDPDDGYTVEELANQFDCKHKVGTLNSNSDKGVNWDPSSLAFIVIFKDQHPQWPSEIFCKTNLNLLPGSTALPDSDETDGNAVKGKNLVHQDLKGHLSDPIPVFTDAPRTHTPRAVADRRFIFVQYFHITSVAYLAPQSKELVHMLDLKFTPEGKRRSAEAWKTSLSLTWAVVRLEKTGDEKVTDKGNPMVPLKEIKRKTVAERLEDLRIGDEQKAQKQWEKAAEGKNAKDGAGSSESA